jgi:hypothetical protein
VKVPDFNLLAQLAACLSGSGLHADWTSLCKNKTCSEYQAELQHCIDQLTEIGRYQQDLEFMALVGVPKDSIVIAQISVTYALSFSGRRDLFPESCLLSGYCLIKHEFPVNLKGLYETGLPKIYNDR